MFTRNPNTLKTQELGVEEGIYYTKTVTERGEDNDKEKAIKNGIESVKNTVEAVEYITISYISIMVNAIFMYRR